MTKALSILVVDDDRDNADLLAELFTMEGHTVEVAYSGDDAIAAFSRTKYDLAFMDVVMPGRNGVDSFLEIKRQHPDARVYMMTAYSVEQLLQQALDNGAIGALSKPVSATHLLRAIDDVRPRGVVLVADDDPDFGSQVQHLVATSGLHCELVTDGKQAVDRIALGGIDVLVLDVNMPLINGIDVLRQLRTKGLEVPTIMVTGQREDYGSALDVLGDFQMTGVLTKPFDPQQLLDNLQRLL